MFRNQAAEMVRIHDGVKKKRMRTAEEWMFTISITLTSSASNGSVMV